MFCKNCGKPISDDQTYCEDCQNQMSEATAQDSAIEEVVVVAEEAATPEVVENPMKRGLKAGIIGMVAPVVSFIATIIGNVIYALLGTSGDDAFIVAGIFLASLFYIAALAIAIVGLISSIKAIKAFTSTPEGVKKPIPALILGILGLSGAIAPIIYALLQIGAAFILFIAEIF